MISVTGIFAQSPATIDETKIASKTFTLPRQRRQSTITDTTTGLNITSIIYLIYHKKLVSQTIFLYYNFYRRIRDLEEF